MDSEEATSHPVTEASSVSSLPSSIYGSENEILSKTIAMNEYNIDNRVKGRSVLDDEEERGYASCKGEFEAASENSVFVGPDEGNVGKFIGEGSSGVDSSETLLARIETLQTSEALAKDDDVDTVNKDVKPQEVVLVKHSELVSAAVDETSEIDLSGDAVSDGKKRTIGSVEKFDLTLDAGMVESGGEVQDGHATKVIEEVGTKRDGKDNIESLSRGDDVNKPEVAETAVVVPKDLKVVGSSDVSLMSDGDSVVDATKVDLADPGVAIVGETEENKGNKNEGEDVPVESVGGGDKISDGGGGDVGTREVGRDFQSSESATVNTHNTAKQKPLEPANHAIGGRKNQELEQGTATDLVNGLDEVSEKSKFTASVEFKDVIHPQELTEVGDTDQIEVDEEADPNDFMSDEDIDIMIGRSEAPKKFIAQSEQGSCAVSQTGVDSSFRQSQRIDGQIVTDSEEADTDDEGSWKELFDPDALAALLKAATGAESDGGSITITSQDGSRLFSVKRPSGSGSSLWSLGPAPRPNHPNIFSPPILTGGGESDANLSEKEKKKLEKLQKIRVKFLRLVHRLGLSSEESVAAQVLYLLELLGGRQGTQTFSLDEAKKMALQLESEERDDIDFSINILVIGKTGLGKSATINSIFGEEKSPIDAFGSGTVSVKEISGFVDGVKVHVVDTPGLKTSGMEQAVNRSILSSVKKFTKKTPPDVVLYVDRLNEQTRDLNDLPLLKTITSALGPSVWLNTIVTLTHAASAPPDGPSGASLTYDVFVTQRSHAVQQSIGHAVGDPRMISARVMNPVSLVENHPTCRKNRKGQKILPNGQSWRPQLLLLCYSVKILSEANSLSKPQDPFDHRKLFGFRARSPPPPPLPHVLQSMLQSRAHPKIPSVQGVDSVDSDLDLDDLSDSDQEEEDKYNQLPPFMSLKKAQVAQLNKEQRKAYFEEYDYRVKLLQKKQWKEELRRMIEIKKKGKDAATDFSLAEVEADSESASPAAVPLPDMALPPSFDSNNPTHRYRFLAPTSQFLASPILDTQGWDHDCGCDGVYLEHNLAIANRFPAAYTIQIIKDKRLFGISLDSSISAKHGENMSSMAGFDIHNMGKQLAYVIRSETKLKNRKNKAAGGISVTFLGENVVVPGVKIENEIKLGKQFVLVGSAGAVRSQQDTAYRANFEVQRRELDYLINPVQSSLYVHVVKWKGELTLGLGSLAEFSIGRNSKVTLRAGINNQFTGHVTLKTSSSEHLSLALAAIIPTAISIYKRLLAWCKLKSTTPYLSSFH